MAGLNRVQLIGRLGADPQSKTTSNDRSVCSFRMAVDRRWRKAAGEPAETADWFNVEAWGRLGEICQRFLHKGRLVFVEGRLQTDRYEQDGETRYFTRVVADNMQMLDRRSPAEEGDGAAAEADLEAAAQEA
jgi:single-strand DNA-binding protein